MEYNIYGDQSCHLENDLFDSMFLGCLKANKSKAKLHYKNIRAIKDKHSLKNNYEIKWTKVSKSKLDFYYDLIEYFINNDDLSFRCVIATGKNNLNNVKYNQTFNEWYYKMYYGLINKVIDNNNTYNVYIDKKDTNGYEKIKELERIIAIHNHNKLKKIQLVNSHEIELLQLCDLLLGAVSYYNRYQLNKMSEAKKQLCNYIIDKFLVSLNETNYDKKFNIFVWEPQK